MSILILVVSDNIVTLFLGWDGLGVSSYFLVVLYLNFRAQNSGIVTIISNRIGDCLIMLFLICLFSYRRIGVHHSWVQSALITIILVAFFTKSAQLPFSTWLPAAIAAPTPISALVHSSTLVTAGCYVLIQMSNQLQRQIILWVVILTRALTITRAGFSSTVETDFKKIVALSTLSQISLVFLCTSCTLKTLAFIHLIAHAIFKSLLFINTGRLIHNSLNNQDLRVYRQWSLSQPVICGSITICTLNLMGITFITGYFSKDSIFERILNLKIRGTTLVLIFTTTLFTYIYSIRLLKRVFKTSMKSLVNFNSNPTLILTILGLRLNAIFTGKLILLNSLGCISVFPINSSLKAKYFLIVTLILSLLSFCWLYTELTTTKVSAIIELRTITNLFSKAKETCYGVVKVIIEKFRLELNSASLTSNLPLTLKKYPQTNFSLKLGVIALFSGLVLSVIL